MGRQAQRTTLRSSSARSIIAVGGGKGGIGKSLVAANLGVQLAMHGRRVVLVDADLGGANLHTCLGIAPPARTLSDYSDHRVSDLAALVTPTGVDRLGLISGARDVLDAANPNITQQQQLLRGVSRLDADVVIIDLGAGTTTSTLDFFLLADHGVLTVVPEPTSIENVYRFIKAAYFRRLKALDLSWSLRPLVERALAQRTEKGGLAPIDVMRYVESRDSRAAAELREEMFQQPLHLVINQTRGAREARLGDSICTACRRYLGVSLRHLASIPYDDAVWKAVRNRLPVVLASPASPASDALRSIAQMLGWGE